MESRGIIKSFITIYRQPTVLFWCYLVLFGTIGLANNGIILGIYSSFHLITGLTFIILLLFIILLTEALRTQFFVCSSIRSLIFSKAYVVN